MKQIITLSLILIFIFASCKNDPIKSDGNPGRIYLNSTFEKNGEPDTTWWFGRLIDFEEDAPYLGGSWSIKLTPGWIPAEGYAESQLTGIEGAYRIVLSAWMKTNGWRGSIDLRLRRMGQEEQILKAISDTNSEWKQFELESVVDLTESDTIAVHLSAGSTEVVSGWALFDLVKLIYYHVDTQ